MWGKGWDYQDHVKIHEEGHVLHGGKEWFGAQRKAAVVMVINNTAEAKRTAVTNFDIEHSFLCDLDQ